ncbi:sigma-54-dependent Fis family transcriptional regulator [candidate division KSB1 bacterium]|nr:sigma-54-dependent Fis family transcriptional regulator [candidate division KSB1 bacterium]
MTRHNSILVIDDEVDFTQLMSEILQRSDYNVDNANDGMEGLEKMMSHTYDLVMLDLIMPNTNGLDILQKIKENDPSLPVIILSGDGRTHVIERAIDLGAFDFLNKPVEWKRLEVVVKNALVNRQLTQEVIQLRDELTRQYDIQNLVGNSSKMQEIFRNLNRIIQTDVTVCIHGEGGAGKETLAKVIHFNGYRKNGPFIAMNCSAIPDALLDEELFGVVQPELNRRKYGKFEQANGGTLYLDEISKLSPMAQVKILKTLQEKRIHPIGAEYPVELDIRVIAGTDKHLDTEVKHGNFREDLYYLVHVFPLFLPPLRDRKPDIPTLVTNFIEKYNTKNNTAVKRISDSAMQYLTEYDWPGNIRELENVLERSMLLVEEDTILPEHLPMNVISHGGATIDGGGYMDIKKTFSISSNIVPLDEVEEAVLKQALRMNNYNMSSTATKLGIGRTTLYRKLQKYQIKVEREH